jgi:antitoxin YefM
MPPADELSGILETAHLLRSPASAARLGRALKRARAGKGRRLIRPQLRAAAGL